MPGREMQSRGRFAIADAATECSFGGLWARHLVEGFVQAANAKLSSWGNWLPPLQERWAREVGGRPLPWYAEIKAQQAATSSGWWWTSAVGCGPGGVGGPSRSAMVVSFRCARDGCSGHSP